MSVTQTILVTPIPRADTPRDIYLRRGFFDFAQSHLSGLGPLFWLLQLYTFLTVSALDEHFEQTIRGALPDALSDLGPRMIIGSLTLTFIGAQLLAGRMTLPPAMRRAPSRWLVGFVFACLLATLWAYRPGIAIDAFISHFTQMLSFALIVLIVRTRRALVLTILTFCLGIGVYLALSWWEWSGGRYEYVMGVVRMVGAGTAYSDPNSFAATLVFSVPLMIWVLVHTSRLWVRLAAVAYMALAAVAVLNTSSRSGLVLFCTACAWALVFLPRGRMKAMALVAVAVAVVTLPMLLSKSQVTRIDSIFSGRTYSKEESTHGRIEGYVVGWHIFREHPLVGVGPGNWSVYRQQKVDGNPLMPHNLTGQLIATRGLAGTLTFLGFLGSTLFLAAGAYLTRRRAGGRWNKAVSKLCAALLMSYVLLLISGLGAHNLARPNWYWCSALMLAALTCRSEEEELETRLIEETA